MGNIYDECVDNINSHECNREDITIFDILTNPET